MRGKDNTWRIKKVIGNGAFYATCKCGFWYPCYRLTDTYMTEIDPSRMYRYCPNCGARKKWYDNNVETMRSNLGVD